MKVLHIDDNQNITNLISEMISSLGFEYCVTNDSKEGLERIKKEKFDRILLDMHMPTLSGIDVIETLERENILKDQKIVILSGFPFTYNQKEELLKKKGIHNCLKKPIEFDDLVYAIKN
ncbi:MAG: response regulator [Nitrosopumilus sp.]|nr:response regulator [Nitrosopumilus sp.]